MGWRRVLPHPDPLPLGEGTAVERASKMRGLQSWKPSRFCLLDLLERKLNDAFLNLIVPAIQIAEETVVIFQF